MGRKRKWRAASVSWCCGQKFFLNSHCGSSSNLKYKSKPCPSPVRWLFTRLRIRRLLLSTLNQYRSHLPEIPSPLVASHLIMGRKEFFAERDEITKERRRLQRERNGYVPGARRQEDSIREKDKRLAETNNLHRQNVDLWLKWVKAHLKWQSLLIHE